MLHKVKHGKDVIIGSEIYKCNSGNIVDLPVKIENDDITPIEEKPEEPKKRKNK